VLLLLAPGLAESRTHRRCAGPTLTSAAIRPSPAHRRVRSVRAHGDTKTEKSRRTLALPQIAVDALRAQQLTQAEAVGKAGNRWEESYSFRHCHGAHAYLWFRPTNIAAQVSAECSE
jgi:hypothetical protein